MRTSTILRWSTPKTTRSKQWPIQVQETWWMKVNFCQECRLLVIIGVGLPARAEKVNWLQQQCPRAHSSHFRILVNHWAACVIEINFFCLKDAFSSFVAHFHLCCAYSSGEDVVIGVLRTFTLGTQNGAREIHLKAECAVFLWILESGGRDIRSTPNTDIREPFRGGRAA